MKTLDMISGDKRFLIIGGSGTGKTHLVGTLCSLMPTLVVTADPHGLDTLKVMDAKPAGIVLLEDWRNAQDYYNEVVSASKTCKALVLDDVGALQRLVHSKLDYTAQGRDEEKLSPDRRQDKVRGELLLGERRFRMDQWGSLGLALTTWIDELLRLSFPVKLFTVLEEEEEHPRTGAAHIYPHLQGSIRRDLSARFSFVGNTFIVNVEGKTLYCLTSHSHPRIETKDRYGIPRTWVSPTGEGLVLHTVDKGQVETVQEKYIGTGL